MLEGIITTRSVRQTADGYAVEVVAKVDAGEVLAGMFIHIPLNRSTAFTVPIREVIHEGGDQVRLVLDCGNDSEGAELVMMFNFEDDTLDVLEMG